MTVAILLQSTLMIFLAEMGDKSQLLMVALTSEYRLRDILTGVAFAVMVLNLLAIAVGSVIGDFLPKTAISLIAGAAFLLFAWTGWQQEPAGEEKVSRKKHGIIAVFGTYLLAELGDKTQLTALALAAGNGTASFPAVFAVFLGASVALYVADVLGLLVGILLGKRLSPGFFKVLSSTIFAACGAIRLLDGFERLFCGTPFPLLLPVICTVLPVSLLLLLGICMIRKNRKIKKQDMKFENIRGVLSI